MDISQVWRDMITGEFDALLKWCAQTQNIFNDVFS